MRPGGPGARLLGGLAAAVLAVAVGVPAPPVASADASADAFAGVSAGRPAPDTTREALLLMWARAHFPGHSGDVMIVPEEGVILTGSRGPFFQHGSPWDYDARVPLLAYGPGRVRAGRHPGAATHEDVGATLAALLGLPALAPPAGRPLGAVVDGTKAAPRVIALVVLDAFRPDYLERYADSLPTLRRLRSEGASFPGARVAVLPSATSVAHASLGTALPPAVHGITGNTAFDRRAGRLVAMLGGASPANLYALSVADRWNVATAGRAVIYVQAGTDYPAAALAGHGGCLLGAAPFALAYYDATTGGWATNPDCYRLPAALEGASVMAGVDSAGGTWAGLRVSSPGVARATPFFSRFEGAAVVSVLESEPFGEDALPDLLLANLKTTDHGGHAFGPFSPRMRATVGEVDRQVERILAALRRRAGPEGFVLIITADHGMPGEPTGPGGRIAYEDLGARVQARFDPSGPPIVLALDGADNQLYLDRERLRALEVEAADVAAFLEGLPFVRAAFAADEVARAAAREAPGAAPGGTP